MTDAWDEFRVDGTPGVPDHRRVALRDRRHDVVLVIPVINEGEKLIKQLMRIQEAQLPIDVVVADGGSTDGSTSPALLSGLGVTTLLVKTGAGRLSAQLRMAFRHVLDDGYGAIITMDGNGKDGVDGIGRIMAALEAGCDYVQGSRFVKGGQAINTPPSRYLGIRLVHAPLTSIGARRWFTDTTNGFRGFSADFLRDPRVDPFRDLFDSYELLAYLPVQVGRLGYSSCEVPVTRRYPSKGPLPTKIHGVSAHSRLLGILWSAVRGRYAPGVLE